MKVSLGTVEVSDHERLAINAYCGLPGLANRATVRELLLGFTEAGLQDVLFEFAQIRDGSTDE